MILVGSRALALRAPRTLRPPKDFDFIGTEEESMSLAGKPGCEFVIIKPGSSDEVLASIAPEGGIKTELGIVPTLDLLFTIKKSHRFKKNSVHFWKTLSDYHYMQALGAKVRPEYQAFLKMREKESYTYNSPRLAVGKAEFFSDDHVTYTYDHDSIHEAVKLQERPAYTYFMKDEAEVMTSRAKFEACPLAIRLNSVVEECMVLAIERSLVPHPGVLTQGEAWRVAFTKVCSTIASGWWREFAYENALHILRLCPQAYFERFEKALAAGQIKLA